MENALESLETPQSATPQLPFSPHLLKKISDLDLSVRTANCMQRENILYIGDLVQLSESQVLAFQSFGRKSFFELRDVLSGLGLRFGMEVPEWPPEDIEALSRAINRGEYDLSEPIEPLPVPEEVLEELQDLVSQARGIGDIFNVHPNELYSRIDPGTWGLLDRDFVLSLPEQEQLKKRLFEQLTTSGKSLHKSELLQAIQDMNPPDELTDNQVLGILVADPRFKSWHGGFIGINGWADSGRKTFTAVLKEIAESVTDVIQADEIVARARSELGFEFNRHHISVHLNKYGLLYDRDAGLWKKAA